MLGISNGKTFTYGDEGEIRQKNRVFRLSLQFNLITCIYINGYYNTDQRQEQFHYKHPQEHTDTHTQAHMHPRAHTKNCPSPHTWLFWARAKIASTGVIGSSNCSNFTAFLSAAFASEVSPPGKMIPGQSISWTLESSCTCWRVL